MYYIDVSNCISINLSTPWYHVPSTASSVPSAVAVVGDGSFTDGWMTVSPMWMTLTARPGSRKRPNGTTRFNTSASYESLWNRGPSTSATSIFNAMTVIYRGFKAPLALSLSPWAANWHLSCKQCIHCIQKPELFLQLTCANMCTIHLFSTGYPTRAVLCHISKTNMTLACKSSVAMSVRIFVQVSWHCYSAIVLGISG